MLTSCKPRSAACGRLRVGEQRSACSSARGRVRPLIAPTCSSVVRAQAAAGVRIDVEKTSWNSRRIFASVAVSAPKALVWGALSDYDNLGRIVPSLVENRCVERAGNSCVLYQVGAQDVAMGVKFSAAVTLRCTEYKQGMPEAAMTAPPLLPTSSGSSASSSFDAGSDLASLEALYPYPATSAPGVPASDISFTMLEGDFQAFRGVWRMQQLGEASTLLSYACFVKPQAWLPVALISGRIENEVVRNLEAVGRYAETQYRQQQQQVARS